MPTFMRDHPRAVAVHVTELTLVVESRRRPRALMSRLSGFPDCVRPRSQSARTCGSLVEDLAFTGRTAVDVVGEFGDSSCVAALGSMLHSDLVDDRHPMPDEVTRCRAAHALASIGGPEAEELLWRALEHGEFPYRVREAALLSLLDLLTPDGWENYTFMNPTRTRLAVSDHARLARLHGDFPVATDVLAMFDFDTRDSERHHG